MMLPFWGGLEKVGGTLVFDLVLYTSRSCGHHARCDPLAAQFTPYYATGFHLVTGLVCPLFGDHPNGLSWVAKIAEVWDPRISRISFFWFMCHDSEFEDLWLLPLDVLVLVLVHVLVNAGRKHGQGCFLRGVC